MTTNLLLILGQSVWLAALLAGSTGIGRFLLRRFIPREIQPITELACAAGLGLALLSYLVFTLSAAQLLSLPMLWVITLLWSLSGIILLFTSPQPLLAENDRKIFSQTSSRVLLFFLFITAALTALTVFTPSWDWDGVAYHLALPKIYLAAGGFVFRPDIYHNLLPQFTEMLYMLGLVFPYGSAAKLIHFSFGLLAAITVYALGRENKLKLAALVGAAIFYTQYLVHIESGTTFIELASAAYVGLSILAVQQALKTGSQKWYYAAALFAGIVGATKWHGLIILALIGAFLLLHAWTKKTLTFKQRLTTWLLILGFGGLPVIPYFARAWIMGGNPIWPLGQPLFGGNVLDPVVAKEMTNFVFNFAGMMRGWQGFLRLPIDLTLFGSAFGVGGHELRWPLLGGLLLLVITLFYQLQNLLKQKEQLKPRPWLLGGGIFIFIVIWFFTSPQVRYLLPLFPILSWGAAHALSNLWKQEQRLAKGLAIICGILLFLVHPPVHRNSLEQGKVILGLESADAFLAKYLEIYPAGKYLNEHVAKNERVLLFKDNRGFYLDVDYLWGDPLNQSLINYREHTSAEELYQGLRELGIRWILYREDIQYAENYYSPRVISLVDELLRIYGEERFSEQGTKVYSLKTH
ncbi:phospholipid carrier-dependent glycosyltransferase [bacterium]|nr:phospholipid carrier-dependent glycosyltransferase [bacterium]